MKKIIFIHNNAISETLSTILVLAISIAVIAATLLWGLPFIESQKRETQIENSKNDFLNLEGAIANLLETPRGAIRTYSFSRIGSSLKEGYMNIDPVGTRLVVWYSNNSNLLEFQVAGLDVKSDEFQIKVRKGGFENVSITWMNETCFLAGTQVLMADDSYKNIEDVTVGDFVKSYDLNFKKVVDSKVTNVFYHSSYEMDEYYLKINNFLEVTPNHKFYSEDQWVYADDLKPGDKLFTEKKEDFRVESIEKIFEKQDSFDLSIENTHNFFVSINKNVDVLVHNRIPDSVYNISSWEEPTIKSDSRPYYTIKTGSDRFFEGTVQIDLFQGIKDEILVGRIFLFDLGNLAHKMPYSDGTFQTIYENGAIISYDGVQNKAHFVKEPNFYYNEEQNIIGFRVIQMRPESLVYGSAGPGVGLFNIRSRMKVNILDDGNSRVSNYIRAHQKIISNYSMQFFGENNDVWLEFFNNSFDFKRTGSTLLFPENNIDIIISTAVIKNRITLNI